MRRPAKLLAGVLVFAYFMFAIGRAADHEIARAHWQPGAHNAIHAINLTWCGRSNTFCYEGNRAARVARCEASARYWYTRPQEAKNGQYLGMFQMGEWARGRYGHGPSVWHQARAAYKNWQDNGWWNQWECAQILGIR